MKKEYYDLLESLHWIAFRNIKPSKQLILENNELLADSAKLLRAYLMTEFNEFERASDSILGIAYIENHETGTMESVDITDFPPDMQMDLKYNEITAFDGVDYYDVCLLADKLKAAFPRNADCSPTFKPRRQPNISHDIAFYYYEKHKPMQAKTLHNLLNRVLPGFNISVPELNTVKVWLTEFNKEMYHPSVTKQQITDMYHDLFDVFRKANRRI